MMLQLSSWKAELACIRGIQVGFTGREPQTQLRPLRCRWLVGLAMLQREAHASKRKKKKKKLTVCFDSAWIGLLIMSHHEQPCVPAYTVLGQM
jgi:hypothetical protein